MLIHDLMRNRLSCFVLLCDRLLIIGDAFHEVLDRKMYGIFLQRFFMGFNYFFIKGYFVYLEFFFPAIVNCQSVLSVTLITSFLMFFISVLKLTHFAYHFC